LLPKSKEYLSSTNILDSETEEDEEKINVNKDESDEYSEKHK
jgi:hypothetical protein